MATYTPAIGHDGESVPVEDQVELLIEDAKSWEDPSWLPELLVHVHGPEDARRLLLKHGLSSLAP